MKKLLTNLMLAFLVGSLAVVSCTKDLKDNDQKQDVAMANMQMQIEALQAALDNYKNVVNPKLNELVAADADLLQALNTAKAQMQEALGTKVSEEAFQQAVTQFQNSLSKIIADQKEVDDAQDLELEALAIRIENYKSDLELDIDTRIAALNAAIGGQINALDARVKANKDAIDKLNNETIPALAARIKSCEDNIGILQTDLEAFQTATAQNLAAIETVCNGLKNTKLNASTYNEFIASFENWKGSVDTKLGAMDTDIKTLQDLMDVLNAELAILKSDEEPGYITLQAYVEGIQSTLQAQIDLLKGSDIDFETAVKNLNDAVQAKLSALDAEIANLKARVQSLVFVPQYTDLKFGIPFSLLTDGENSIAIAYNEPVDHFDVVYKVAPDSLAEGLAAHAKEVFTFVIENGLKTRVPELAEPKLTILEAEGDNETGKITFTLFHENFEATVENDEPVLDAYAVSLVVADEAKGIHVASEYTGTVNVPSPKITVDMKNLYKVKIDGADTTNVVAYTKVDNEYENEIEYIDSTLRYPYKDCFIAAKITPVSNKHMTKMGEEPHYTYEILRELGWNMPQSSLKITIADSDDKCAFLKHAEIADAKYATVNIDSTKALKLVKEHLIGTSDVHSKKFNYAYNNGINSSESATLNMSATITLGKANKLNFEITHDMKWTYEIDKFADHKNIGILKENWVHHDLLSTPVLVRDTLKVALDGSDKAYGIEVSDFYGKAFTKASAAVKPTPLAEYNYTVKTPNVLPSQPELTFVLDSVAISSWGALDAQAKVCKASYDLAGNYVLPFSKVSNAIVTINATDRDRTPIEIVLDPFEVILLGGNSRTDGGQYVGRDTDYERYLIKSANLAGTVYDKYVAQKIFSAEKYTQKNAFGLAEDSEFNNANVYWNNPSNVHAARFDKVFTNNTQGGSFYLQSNDVEDSAHRLTSSALMTLSRNYDSHGDYLPQADTTKFVDYSFYSYIGQVVNVHWPLQAVPAEPYKFTTYGALENAGNYYFNISPGTVWYNPDNITRANTELDLIMNGNIQVVTGTSGEGGVNPANLSSKGLVPKFKLTDKPEHKGVTISDPTFESNVKYYGQVDSVAVKSALYVSSHSILFYVPGSENMYVNYSDKKIDSVFVRKFNPIAAPAKQVLTGNAVINAGSAGVLPLNMVDINGNYIYKNGYAQSNKGKYKETIYNIFNSISFKLVSVNGSEEFTGWSLVSGDTPDALKLNVPADAEEGVYTIVVDAHSCWKDYTYTLTIRNGNVSGGIDAGNQDYGNGGNETWK